jgi:hypothetical protein
MNSGGPLSLRANEQIATTVAQFGSTVLESLNHGVCDTSSHADAVLATLLRNPAWHPSVGDVRNANANRAYVGRAHTTFNTGNGNGRRQRYCPAKRLLEKYPNRIQLHASTRIVEVLFDDENVAYGVRDERGHRHTADTIVLAAGVFGTFELLLNSGIGPAKLVPFPRVVNDRVGEGAGNDIGGFVPFLRRNTPQNITIPGAQLFGCGDDSYYTVWQVGNHVPLLGWVVSDRLPFMGIPAMIVQAMATLERFTDMVIFSSTRSNGGTGRVTRNDDGALLWTEPRLKNGPSNATKQFIHAMQDVGYKPVHVATKVFNIPTINFDDGTVDGSQRGTASDYHFWGGAGPDVLDDHFQVRGVQNLYVSDASIFENLTAGPMNVMVMLAGYAVAGALYTPVPAAPQTQPSLPRYLQDGLDRLGVSVDDLSWDTTLGPLDQLVTWVLDNLQLHNLHDVDLLTRLVDAHLTQHLLLGARGFWPRNDDPHYYAESGLFSDGLHAAFAKGGWPLWYLEAGRQGLRTHRRVAKALPENFRSDYRNFRYHHTFVAMVVAQKALRFITRPSKHLLSNVRISPLLHNVYDSHHMRSFTGHMLGKTAIMIPLIRRLSSDGDTITADPPKSK